jgi:FkbM family methyltransferase
LREQILGYYGIPYSRYGVPRALIRYLRGSGPIALIDVGASEGRFTASLKGFAGVRKALLVEPLPHRCERLKEQFPGEGFQIECAAAGDTEKEVELDVLAFDYSTSLLKINRDDPSASGTHDFSVRQRIRTRVRPLDRICEDLGFAGPIDLLKLDVQGAEGLVMKGALQTLKRATAIWTEVSFRALYEGSVTFSGMYELCRASGFRLQAIEEGFCGADGELLQGDALFVREALPKA